MSYGQSKTVFPYQLTKADIPQGFMLSGPFSPDDKALSLSANNGIVKDKKLISQIYEKMNVNAINEVYVKSYVPGEHAEDALEFYIVQYKSKQLLDKEQLKLPRDKGSRFLKKNSYLFVIRGSGYGFVKQVNVMADRLKQRWNLTDISN